VVVSSHIGDSESDNHLVEKRRLGQLHPVSPKVIAGMKRKFVDTGLALTGEERLRGTAIRVCRNCLQMAPLAANQRVEVDNHALSGFAARCVQDMG